MTEKNLPENNEQQAVIPPPATNSPPSNKVNLFLLIALVALLAGGIVYFWKSNEQKKLEDKLNALEQTIQNSPTGQPVVADQTQNIPEPSSENNQEQPEITASQNQNTIPIESTLTSLDGTWNLYTNHEYGFSMKIPKNTYHPYGSMCRYEANSYRPKAGLVPVKIFEDEKIYISTEYFYKMGGQTTNNGYSNFSTCEKMINSIANLQAQDYSSDQSKWTLWVKKVSTDDQIEAFIDEKYGEACKMGEKVASNQAGVFEVKVLGDGKEMDESECVVNYMTTIRYSPEKSLLVSWDMGQAPTFMSLDLKTVYDSEMTKSFKFE